MAIEGKTAPKDGGRDHFVDRAEIDHTTTGVERSQSCHVRNMDWGSWISLRLFGEEQQQQAAVVRWSSVVSR